MIIVRFIKKFLNKLRNLFKRLLCTFFKKRYIYNFNREWFEGKRVAIVGGADSVLAKKMGQYIDSFDVVVRINKGVELIEDQYEYVGTRTDFLFHSLYDEGVKDRGSSPITLSLWEKYNVKNIVYSNNCSSSGYAASNFLKFLKNTNCKKTITQIPGYLLKKNLDIVKSPTTGFSAINTIFNCNPTQIYLTGITFMKTSHNKLYRNDMNRDYLSSSSHDTEAEYQYIKKIFLENKNKIYIDEVLRKIIESN